MDYLKHYNKLIETRKFLNRKKGDGIYYEKHHIIMLSMGGTNDDENLILLTAREHFLAHWLLWRIYRNKSSAYAFSMMCNPGKSGNRKITSSIAYSEMKEAMSKMTSLRGSKNHIGNKNSMFGKKHSDNTKRKMRIKKIGIFDGVKNPRCRNNINKIYQYTFDLILIKKWDCTKECANLYKISPGNISMTAKKNSKDPLYYLKVKNFIFSFTPLMKILPDYKQDLFRKDYLIKKQLKME